MGALEKAMESLRSLVETQAWDYSVVWKLGEDPSRFIEWMGCCCSGGKSEDHAVIKLERSEEHHSIPICRDTHFQHPVSTKACENLARLPSSIPLYSGIHGEIAVSSQTRWINQGIASNSNSSQEPVETQVLIPVAVGLIELFAAKHMPRDQKIIEYVKAQFDVVDEEEVKTVLCQKDVNLTKDPYHPAAKHSHSHIPNQDKCPSVLKSRSRCDFESTSGFNRDNNPSIELHSDAVRKFVSDVMPEISKLPRTERHMYCQKLPKQEAGTISEGGRCGKGTGQDKVIHKSKNLVSERNRRNRISAGILTLRSLVPNITKMAKAETLGDAADYIVKLKEEVKKLEDELQEGQEEVCHNAQTRISKFDEAYADTADLPVTEKEYGIGENKPIEAQMEVCQIGANCFLLKIISRKKQGGFAKLLQAMDYLGIEVVDANMTTCHYNVLSILKVEIRSKEMTPDESRKSLDKLTELVKLGHL